VERRTTRGSGGDGGRVGDEDEEAKRAGEGTPEEVGGRRMSSMTEPVRQPESCTDGVFQRHW
jgi:hypothetical protein